MWIILAPLIVYQHLEPYCYQKVMDRYEVVSLDCSYKDLDAINMYIILIDQHRGLVKFSALIGTNIRSVSECSQKTPTLPPRVQTEQSFPLIHNIF